MYRSYSLKTEDGMLQTQEHFKLVLEVSGTLIFSFNYNDGGPNTAFNSFKVLELY